MILQGGVALVSLYSASVKETSTKLGQAAILFGDVWLLTFNLRPSGLEILLLIGALSR